MNLSLTDRPRRFWGAASLQYFCVVFGLAVVAFATPRISAQTTYVAVPVPSQANVGVGSVAAIDNNDDILSFHGSCNGGSYAEIVALTGAVTCIGALPGDETSSGLGLNSGGTVVGGSVLGAQTRAFLYDGSISDISKASDGQIIVIASRISDGGIIAGSTQGGIAAISTGGSSWTTIGLLPGYTFSGPFGVNDGGVVVGLSYNCCDSGTSFIYDGSIRALPSNFNVAGYNNPLNNSGQVVGAVTLSSNAKHAALYNGSVTDLGTLGGSTSYANGINDSGLIVHLWRFDRKRQSNASTDMV